MSVNHVVNHLVGYHQVLPTPSKSASIATPSFFPISSYWGGWNDTRQVNVVTGSVSDMLAVAKADREDQRQTNAAFIGGTGTILLAGLMACALKQLQADARNLRESKEFLRNLDVSTANGRNVKPILKKHIEILEMKSARAREITLLAVGILATSIAAFTGGMFAISWLVTASIVSAVTLGAVAAFGFMWHLDDQTALPPQMQKDLRELAGYNPLSS